MWVILITFVPTVALHAAMTKVSTLALGIFLILSVKSYFKNEEVKKQ